MASDPIVQTSIPKVVLNSRDGMGLVQFCAHEQAADVNFEVAIKQPMDGCIRRQPIRIFPKEAKAISESRGRERRGGKCRMMMVRK